MFNYDTLETETVDQTEILEMPQFANVGEAVWALVEQLYQVENDIDEEYIDEAMQYLCNSVGIDESELKNRLQVVHWRKALPKQSPLFNSFADLTFDYAKRVKGAGAKMLLKEQEGENL